MNTLDRIVRQLSDDALVTNLNRHTAELDAWHGIGADPDREPALRRERLTVAALRREYRRRTGEII